MATFGIVGFTMSDISMPVQHSEIEIEHYESDTGGIGLWHSVPQYIQCEIYAKG